VDAPASAVWCRYKVALEASTALAMSATVVPPADAVACPRGGKPCVGAFPDQVSFENSARAAKMPKTSVPAAVVVSIAAP
jgi:hypothetical protein